ncbi:MAG TPA: TonB-dependent receptor [Thermoanaerobaculia bacterium]|jgi:vitamin B12 transporter|nr:TonB-dependent receptor [Thermoanaerobaculia bacterium]
MRQIVPILIAGALGGGLPAAAQSQSPTPVPSFSDAVVVTATLDGEDRRQTPASTTVLDQREIAARQANDLSTLLGTVPGLTLIQAGPAGQQTSLFTRGTNSNQTLLLWNGIQLNDPYFGGANWQFVPLDGVERVEVVRGPFSALYGSNALGGVVQVLTGTHQGGTLNVEGGEYGYKRGGLAAGADAGPIRFDLTGNLRRGGNEFVNDDFDSDEGVARALWSINPATSLGVLVRGNNSQTGIPFSDGEVSPHREISWHEREVAVPFQLTQGSWQVEAQASRTDFDNAFRDPDDPFSQRSDTSSYAERGRAVVSWHDDDNLRLAFGSEVERLNVTASSDGFTNLDAAHQRTWAAFGEGSWGAGPVRLDLGLRRDDNDVYGGKTSLRAGTVLKLAEGTLLRASYGEAFRAPSLGELFFPGSANPDLKPEDSRSYEVGISQVTGGWRLNVTGFENRLHNLIDFDLATFTEANIGRARTRGVEAETGYRKGIFDAELNATFLNTEDQDTGLELLRRPKRSANLILTARPGAFTLNAVERYVGNRADADPITFARTTNPGYTRLDLAARWRARTWLSPYARVENVADRRYSEALGFPSTGRTVIGGVSFNF